jgi:hypothetical protein
MRQRGREPISNAAMVSRLRVIGEGSAPGTSQEEPDAGRNLVTSARASSAAATATAAFTCLVAIAAEDRAIPAGFKRYGSRLPAPGTDHRSPLRRSRTVAATAPTPLVVFLCHTARLATLRGRVAALLEERLISSGEGKILSAIAASKLNVAGHGSPRAECTANCIIFDKRIQ